jgi:ubiquitin C-terminal hydrolase
METALEEKGVSYYVNKILDCLFHIALGIAILLSNDKKLDTIFFFSTFIIKLAKHGFALFMSIKKKDGVYFTKEFIDFLSTIAMFYFFYKKEYQTNVSIAMLYTIL